MNELLTLAGLLMATSGLLFSVVRLIAWAERMEKRVDALEHHYHELDPN